MCCNFGTNEYYNYNCAANIIITINAYHVDTKLVKKKSKKKMCLTPRIPIYQALKHLNMENSMVDTSNEYRIHLVMPLDKILHVENQCVF